MGYLHIFDLDGTLVINPEFYRLAYSGSLEQLIFEVRGDSGLAVLASCRQQYQGRGELALPALAIPFSTWCERLALVSVEQIMAQQDVVDALRVLPGKKALYTGSPRSLTMRLLRGLGFGDDDFATQINAAKATLFPSFHS